MEERGDACCNKGERAIHGQRASWKKAKRGAWQKGVKKSKWNKGSRMNQRQRQSDVKERLEGEDEMFMGASEGI